MHGKDFVPEVRTYSSTERTLVDLLGGSVVKGGPEA